MDDLYDLLARQGFLTTRDAARLGHSANALTQAVAAGRLRRGVRGVFLPPDALTTETEIASLTRGILSTDLLAAASHQSALAILGLPCHRVPVAPIHVADARKSSRVHESVHRHVLRPGDRVIEVDGWRTVGAALACVQVAARSGVASGLVAMDAALRLRLTTSEDLVETLATRVRRGALAARRALALADGRAESPGESLVRLGLAGLPWSLDLQVALGPYRVDLLVDGRVVVEFDGEAKYAGAEGKSALVHEKAREDWLRGEGYEVVRVTWSQLAYPATLRQTVQRAVLRARARRVA